MLERARHNAEVHQLSNVQFFNSDLTQPLHEKEWAKKGFSAALLDPPREGAQVVVERLAKLKVPRILYVSCNPATLARDAALLVGRGYRLQKAGVLDMFAQTGHTEAMALFVKS